MTTHSWRDVKLYDTRRPEEQSPALRATLPAQDSGIGLLLLGLALAALLFGLHLVAPAERPAGEAGAGLQQAATSQD